MSTKKKANPNEAPYRGGAPGGAAAPAADDGLVGDLIRQFADPLAFYRELVQNAIDAGSSKIVVQLLGSDEGMRIAVRDDGSGMTQEVLEQQLVVLFRSSKEEREDAIGKFGIGFVSVFAVEPELVVVDTSTGEGARFTLHLHPDQSWDLFRTEGTKAKGTTVTLHVALAKEEHASFVERSASALRRWCRHARVPIQLVALAEGAPDPLRDERIDTELGLEDALVSVIAQSADGLTQVAAGIGAQSESRGSFYNQGLLLAEVKDHGHGAVLFKVSDKRLEHTLSRDDVRRDASYQRAVELVERTLRGPLVARVEEVLRTCAKAWIEGDASAGERWADVLVAATRAELAIDPREVPVPVAGTRETQRAHRFVAEPLASKEEGALERALAQSGRPVADLRVAGSDEARAMRLGEALGKLFGAWPRSASETYTLIVPEPLEGKHAALFSRVDRLLAGVHRRPSALVPAKVIGAGSKHLAFAASDRRDPWVVAEKDLHGDPFRLLLRPPLVVRIDHPIVRNALARFVSAPAAASTLLARAILIARGSLTPARAEELTVLGVQAVARGHG